MSDKRICRRCLLEESGRADIAGDIKQRIGRIPENEKTGETEYAKRLAVCGECEHLIDGCCMKCGCYPELRAAYAGQKCPEKKWKREE